MGKKRRQHPLNGVLTPGWAVQWSWKVARLHQLRSGYFKDHKAALMGEAAKSDRVLYLHAFKGQRDGEGTTEIKTETRIHTPLKPQE